MAISSQGYAPHHPTCHCEERSDVAISSQGYAPHHPTCHCEERSDVAISSQGYAPHHPTCHCEERSDVAISCIDGCAVAGGGDSHGPMALGMTYRYIFLLVVTAQRS